MKDGHSLGLLTSSESTNVFTVTFNVVHKKYLRSYLIQQASFL